jgi:hypothetical protein
VEGTTEGSAGTSAPDHAEAIVDTHPVGRPGRVVGIADLPPRPARTTARHAAPPPRWAWLRTAWLVGLPAALVVLGTAIRVRQWAVGRSLWLDEALVAKSIVSRDAITLVTEPLLSNQAAPVLWLWLERLCVDLFGTDERSLRVVPLLAGTATLGLTWLLARRLLPAWATPFPVAFVALSPSLVYYSTEVKQYATDTAVVLTVLLLALSADTTRRRLVRLTVAGSVLLWLSHAAVLAMAGVSVVLVLRHALRRRWREAGVTTAVLAPWLLSLLASYLLLLADLRNNQVLLDYWDYTFPGEDGLVAWFVDRWHDLADTPLDYGATTFGLLVLAAAAARLLLTRRVHGAVLLAPVPMATLGAGLSAYPFAGRLSLWLAPVAAVASAALLPSSVGLDRPGLLRLGWAALAVPALLLPVLPGMRDTLPALVEARYVEELRPVLEQVARERQPGDLVYIHIAGRGAYDYYERFINVRQDGTILFVVTPDEGCDETVALRTGRFATERVWLVFAHEFVDVERLGSTEDLLSRIQVVSSITRTITDVGARAFLFDPVAGPQAVQPDVEQNPLRCLAVFRRGATGQEAPAS